MKTETVKIKEVFELMLDMINGLKDIVKIQEVRIDSVTESIEAVITAGKDQAMASLGTIETLRGILERVDDLESNREPQEPKS